MSDLKKLASLQKRRTGTSAKSFAAYLSEIGDPAARLQKALSTSKAAFSSADPTRGAGAEGLAAAGLSRSGFSDYLSQAARAKEQRASTQAYADYLADRRGAVDGYGAYLDSLDKQTSSLEKSVLSYAKTNRLTDAGQLKSYALSLGLTEEAATRAATEAADAAVRTIRDAVLKSVISNDMGEIQARTYALAQGLNEAEADAIGRFAKAMRDAVLGDLDLPDIFN